jgi:hypothetical protein
MSDMPWINSYPAGVRWDREITPGPVQKILDDAVAIVNYSPLDAARPTATALIQARRRS